MQTFDNPVFFKDKLITQYLLYAIPNRWKLIKLIDVNCKTSNGVPKLLPMQQSLVGSKSQGFFSTVIFVVNTIVPCYVHVPICHTQ